jgi:hypothetical protein
MFESVVGVAQKTGITEGVIETYVNRGWVATVVKQGTTFLPEHQQYRLKFVHHLRTKMGLSDKEVTTVLRFDSPPYSLANVPSILAKHRR